MDYTIIVQQYTQRRFQGLSSSRLLERLFLASGDGKKRDPGTQYTTIYMLARDKINTSKKSTNVAYCSEKQCCFLLLNIQMHPVSN